MLPVSKLKAAFAAAALAATGITACSPPNRDIEYIAQDESVISEICDSGRPVIVIDSFSRREPELGVRTPFHQIDIDGDLFRDIGHGDMVEAIYRTNGQDVIAYGINITEDGLLNYNEVYRAMIDIIYKIESGELEKPAAISLSLSNNHTLQDIEARLGTDLNLTPRNIRERRDTILLHMLEGINDPERDLEPRQFFDNFILVYKLNTLGVPVIAAAGNEYATNVVNLDALLGGISVGAMNVEGTEITPYTNFNQLTQVYRPGDIVARRVDGGIDITGDNLPEFPESWANAKFSLVEIYNGKSATTELIGGRVVASEPGYDFTSTAYGQLKHAGTNTPFRIDSNDNLRFDPLNNGDPAQIALIRGTSFAVPNICHPDYVLR